MTNLIQLTDKHYAVKVPVGVTQHDCEIARHQDEFEQHYFKYPSDKFRGLQNYDRVMLPTGNWQIAFLANTATDEDWKKVVNPYTKILIDGIPMCELKEPMFENYMERYNLKPMFKTATESAHSLLHSKGIYLVNPMGERPERENLRFYSKSYFETINEWQSYEDKTGNYLILENI